MSTSHRAGDSVPVVRLLGPVDVVDAGGRVWVPRTSLRMTLLALLAVEAGRVIEGERLLDMAWNGEPPSSGLSALRFHVSKLRHDMPPDLIETVPGGYQLHATTDVRLVEEGVSIGDALSHWRGEPMTGASSCAVLDRERERLGEFRLCVAERAYAEEINDGDVTSAITQLRRLCLEHPVRESLWARLIIAEYRVGNQADALRSFGTLRANLVDELGIDPSPELQRLEARILQHDPELDPSRGRPRESTKPSRGNLPAPTSSFVGRRTQLDELEGLIEQRRLLALVGVGGVGKTRLGLELATRAAPRFDGGVWVVDLWQIDDPSLVEDAIIATLGLQHAQGRDRRDILVDGLVFSPVLLVLDTCEHVIDAVSDLAEYLIAHCPRLCVVATSREVLSSPSAVSRSVDSLGSDAVTLFAARAQATRGGFDLSSDVRPAVERICEQLDGIPLAIELVAARSATLDPRTIEARLHDVFTMARGSGRVRAERHRTLEATITWSYELLEPAEQLVFDRLSVFLGGFTLSAAEHVCSGGGVNRSEVMDLLERLVDKSMVTTVDDQVLGRRFRLLDTTRVFGRRRLAEDGEPAAVKRRHAEFYATWATEVYETAWGLDARRVRRELLAEIPNLRLATEWSIATDDLDAALALASLGRLLAESGRYDAIPWLEPVLDMDEVEVHRGFVPAARSLAHQLFGAGDLDAAERMIERALALGEEPLLLGLVGVCKRARAYATTPPDQSLLDSCWINTRRAIELADDPITKLSVYGPFLFYLSERPNLEEFYRYRDEYMQLLSEVESESRRVMFTLGAGSLAEVDPEAARPMVEEGLAKSVELGIPYVTSRMRGFLARIDAVAGRHEQAAGHLFGAIEEAAATGSWFIAWGWMHRLALVLADAGGLGEAVGLHHAIPAGRALVWANDAPDDMLRQAEEQLGAERYAELARRGAELQRADLIPWIRNVIVTIEHQPAQS